MKKMILMSAMFCTAFVSQLCYAAIGDRMDNIPANDRMDQNRAESAREGYTFRGDDRGNPQHDYYSNQGYYSGRPYGDNRFDNRLGVGVRGDYRGADYRGADYGTTAGYADVGSPAYSDGPSYGGGSFGGGGCPSGQCPAAAPVAAAPVADQGCPPEHQAGDCWCLYCKYEPCYTNCWRCIEVPQYCTKKCCRQVPQYYQVQRCRYVPQYYCETCCRYCPEYYDVQECRTCKKWICDKKCNYVPKYYYKRVCCPNNACCPQ